MFKIPGEAIVDPRLLRSCPRQHKPQPLPQLPYSIHTIETMIATELKVGILKSFEMKNDIVLLQLLDRKDRKDVVCPLTPSTTSSDSSSPSSSEEGGAEEMVTIMLSYFHTFMIAYLQTCILIYFHNLDGGLLLNQPQVLLSHHQQLQHC